MIKFLTRNSFIFIIAFSLLLAGCNFGTSNDKDDHGISDKFGSDPDGGAGGGDGGEGDDDDDAEACIPIGPIEVTPPLINFGLNQVGQVECQTIRVTDCVSFSAEIDDSSDTDIITGDDGDEEVQEFFLMTEGGSEATGRLDITPPLNSVDVCYRRAAPGGDHGRVNIVVGGGSYAFIIPLSGRTAERLFTISQPVEGQLVWEHDGISTNNGSSFTLPVSGTLNPNLVSTFTNNQVTLSAGGTSNTITHGDDFSFEGTVEIPTEPNYYPVNISKDTIDGTITVTKNVIRFYKPQVTLEVRKPDGELVNVVEAECEEGEEECEEPDPIITDSEYLHAGVLVSNLPVSGPRGEHPVRIKLTLTKPDGSNITLVNNEHFYTGFEFGESTGENGRCGAGFADPANTYCVPLPHAFELGRGVNTLKATVCNEYTDETEEEDCAVSITTIILDNSLPTISCDTPGENKIYALSEDIVLKCVIRNYAPHVQEGGEESELLCPVKIWLNTSTAINPVPFDPNDPNYPTSTGAFRVCPTVLAGATDSTESGNSGNIKRGKIIVNLSAAHGNKLAAFTNLVQLRTQNARGHVTIKVISFQRGDYAKSSFNTLKRIGSGIYAGRTGNIETKQLGWIHPGNGQPRRTPIMANISEGTLKSPEVIAVVEKLLNDPEDGLKFSDIVQGGKMPGDENGNNREDGDEYIDFEEDLDYSPGENFWDLTYREQKKWIWENIHSSMPQKVRALNRYRVLKAVRDEAEPGDLENVFFRDQCDASSNDPKDFEEGWDLACDSCKNRIPTALVTYDTYQYIFRDIYQQMSSVYDLRPEWPNVCGEDIDAASCMDEDDGKKVQGKWRVGKIDLKDNGYIDLDLCLVGEGDVHESEPGNRCEDVPDNNDHKPAFWGHAAAIPLIEGGITGISNDPLLPVIWNLRKLRLKLTDVLQLKKITLDDGTHTNKVIVHKDNIIDGIDGSIQMKPYLQCADYYARRYGYDEPTPWGCDPHGYVYPMLIDLTAPSGELAWADLGNEGRDNWLLDILLVEMPALFKDVLSCMVDEMVNPIINETEFKFPPWVPEESDLRDLTDLRFAVDDTDDEVTIEFFKDAENPVFTFEPNIKDAGLVVEDGKLQLKLPITLGAANVTTGSALFDALDHIGGYRSKGYMYRPPVDADFEDNYPLEMDTYQMKRSTYLSASLGVEEVLHAATHILWQKGPKVILDMADVEELDPPSDRELDDWTVGIDNVILGRFDICGGISDGLLSSELPPGILFQEVMSVFGSNATHWDIKIDKKQPPTLLINPVEGDPDAVEIQLGLSNVKVDIMNFIEKDPRGNRRTYEIGDSVFKLRLDALVKLTVKYENETRRLEVYINPYEDIPFYISIIDRGRTYDDEAIISELERYPGGILPILFGKISRSYDPEADEYDPETGEGNQPGIAMDLPANVTEFNDMEPENNIDAGVVEECEGGDEPVYHVDRFNYSKKPGIPAKKYDNWTISAYITDPLCGVLGENELRDTLCQDFGIREVSFGNNYPYLEFDTESGYIHLSAKLIIDVYEWLWDGNQTNVKKANKVKNATMIKKVRMK